MLHVDYEFVSEVFQGERQHFEHYLVVGNQQLLKARFLTIREFLKPWELQLDMTGVHFSLPLEIDLFADSLRDIIHAVVVAHLYFSILDDLSRGYTFLAKVHIDLIVLFVDVST